MGLVLRRFPAKLTLWASIGLGLMQAGVWTEAPYKGRSHQPFAFVIPFAAEVIEVLPGLLAFPNILKTKNLLRTSQIG